MGTLDGDCGNTILCYYGDSEVWCKQLCLVDLDH